jgi:hypothetical protein
MVGGKGDQSSKEEGNDKRTTKVGGTREDDEDGEENEVEELVIIPTTFKAREETKFTLAVFADTPVQLREYTGPKPPSALLGARH